MKIDSKRLVMFMILVLLLIFARIPFLPNTLVGEEGSFAFLVASPQPSSDLSASGRPEILIGNIDKKPHFVSFERTLVPYVILEDLVGTITRPFRITEIEGFGARTAAVRAVFLSLFIMGIAGTVWLASGAGLLSMLIAMFALTTPLMMGASIQPQLDGTLGVFLLGLSAWILVSTNRLVLIFVAGFLVGIGRHEWVIAFLIALLLCWAIAFAMQVRIVRPFGSLAAGILLGVGCSYALSPADYMAGFQVMKRVIGTVSPLRLAFNYSFYLVPALCLVLAATVFCVVKRRDLLLDRPNTLVVSVSGVIILAGFSLSGWPGDGFPRYYAPAVALATASLVFVSGRFALARPLRIVCAAVLILGLIWNAIYLSSREIENVSITSAPGLNLNRLAEHYARTNSRTLADQVILLESAGFWLYFPDADFISADLGELGAVDWLKRNRPDLVARFRGSAD